jgi:MFS family permease
LLFCNCFHISFLIKTSLFITKATPLITTRNLLQTGEGTKPFLGKTRENSIVCSPAKFSQLTIFNCEARLRPRHASHEISNESLLVPHLTLNEVSILKGHVRAKKQQSTKDKRKVGLLGSIILPLALAQFVCSYAASNMNVAINDIAHDLGTTVVGVQTAITFFTLTMAALMIPGSKLTDISGRKKIFIIGLSIYAIGALIAALAPVLGVMFIGYSILEGLGTALLIPPVYILVTVSFTGVSRAKNFGIVSAAGGIGAAAGPLIGGIITSAISWRASFILQVLLVISIIILGLRIKEPAKDSTKHHFDFLSTILSAVGLVLIVIGLQTTSGYGWLTASNDFIIGGVTIIPKGSISPFLVFLIIGILFIVGFYYALRHKERAGKEPLIKTRILHNRTSNLGLITQNIQWLILQGSFFVVSVFLQTVRGFSAIETGLILTASTIGILFTSGIAGKLAKLRSQRLNIRSGFVLTIIGILLILGLFRADSPIFYSFPGLFLIGAGVGIMLTSSVNVVQSEFSDQDQGEISGLSRSLSNLGSSFGVSIVGSVLVSSAVPGNGPFAVALIVMVAIAVIGLIAAILIPKQQTQTKSGETKQ